jgi:hypothetical protein
MSSALKTTAQPEATQSAAEKLNRLIERIEQKTRTGSMEKCASRHSKLYAQQAFTCV